MMMVNILTPRGLRRGYEVAENFNYDKKFTLFFSFKAIRISATWGLLIDGCLNRSRKRSWSARTHNPR